MRLGFKTMPQHVDWPTLLQLWREVDAIDAFESAWVFDHFYPIYGDSAGPCLEGWTILSALAQATSRVRVGSMVNGVVYRHPAVLASMASSLDIISNGRLELGLGAAWNEQECDAYGIELGSLTERFDRFDEYLEVVVGLLSSETTTFSGRYYELTDARNEPKGPQPSGPPICIGGAGPRRTLPAVARWASHWNFPGGSREAFTKARDRLEECCVEIGRDPSEITVSTHLVVTDDMSIDALPGVVEGYAELGLDLGIVYPWPSHLRAGLVEAVHARVADLVNPPA